MARKEITVDIQDRDQLLTFKIREMPATQLGSWIARAMLLVSGTGLAGSGLTGSVTSVFGANMPDGIDIQEAKVLLAGNVLAALGKMDYDKTRPLLDELLGCCSRVIGGVEERCTPESVDGYILDVKTLFKLHREAAKLNLGFLQPEAERLSGSPAKDSTETR